MPAHPLHTAHILVCTRCNNDSESFLLYTLLHVHKNGKNAERLFYIEMNTKDKSEQQLWAKKKEPTQYCFICSIFMKFLTRICSTHMMYTSTYTASTILTILYKKFLLSRPHNALAMPSQFVRLKKLKQKI